MIDYDLTQIRALAFDVDGVLSQPVMTLLSTEKEPVRTANVKDGYVLQLAAKCGLKLAIITGGRGEPTRHRYEALGFQDVYMASSCKLDTLLAWMQKYNLKPNEVLYMGDDIPDYEVMQHVGCPCCPSDAAPEIRRISTYISPLTGGNGCVRDVVEQVLRAHGQWMQSSTAFGW